MFLTVYTLACSSDSIIECSSYLEGDHLTQARPLNHQVAMKMNPRDQSQVLKDQQGIRTHNSKGRHSSQSKDEADGLVPLSKFFGSPRVDTFCKTRFVFIKVLNFLHDLFHPHIPSARFIVLYLIFFWEICLLHLQ